MSKIEMGKQYVTVVGNRPVRILCVDRPATYPVCALDTQNGDLYFLTPQGEKYSGLPVLKEYDPMEEVKKLPVDAPIWVRVDPQEKWVPRHFCKVEEDRVYTFKNGRTSFTKSDRVPEQTSTWKYFSINKPEGVS